MNDKTKNTLQRFLLFIICVPAIIALTVLLPEKKHLYFNIFIIIMNCGGTLEFAAMLEKKSMGIKKLPAFLFAVLPGTGVLLYVSFDVNVFVIPAVLLACAAYIFISCALTVREKLEGAALRAAGAFACLLYPGAFFMTLIFFSMYIYSTTLIITFLCVVFLNESCAWLFGSLFGKGNNNIVAASPGKSIAGFTAGLLFSTGASLAAFYIAPEPFSSSILNPRVSLFILGFLTGLAAAFGDLFESAIKRSAGIKDSGGIIPGRGGVLDCIDAISFAAPVFLVSYKILFAV